MGCDGIVTVTLDARVEDKHKAGVLGEAASSPPLPRLVPAGLCPLWEGGSSEGRLGSGVPVPPGSHLGLFWHCP